MNTPDSEPTSDTATAQHDDRLQGLEREMAALRERDERFQTLLNAIPDLLFINSGDGTFLSYHTANPALLVASPEQFLGRRLDQVFPPELANPFLAAIQRALQTGQVQSFEYALPFKQELRYYEARMTHSSADQVVTLVRDITDRTRAEMALRSSESRFQLFMDRSPAAAWITDAHGLIYYVNSTYFDMFALPERELVGRSIFELYPAAIAQQFLDNIQTVAQTQQALETVEMAPRRDGSTGQFLVYKFPLADGSPTLLIGGIAIDITARRQLEEERRQIDRKLQEAQRLESLGVLAGGIAHDFNNLLVSVLGYSELALFDLAPGSDVHNNISAVLGSARRAAELTNQLLAYSGRGQFVIQPLKLNQVIHEMADLIQLSVARRVAVRYELAEQLPTISADATQIRQVLLNLLINASEAIGEAGGTITLTTDTELLTAARLHELAIGEQLAEGNYVRLRVHDTGAGMDDATRLRIFEPFFSTKFVGRGLGLAAVQGVVRGHRGALHVESIPGQGSTFLIWLPADDLLVDQPEPLTSRAMITTGTILVIDDEPDVRTVIARLLERMGFAAQMAPDGPAALEAIRAGIPNLVAVILDLTMPQMSGDAVARVLRTLLPTTPVVLTSGYTAEEVGRRFADIGFAGFLQKPFSRDTLRTTLLQALGVAQP